MDDVILFRIAERMTLTAVILIVAVIVMIGFWKAVTSIDLKEGSSVGIVGSFVFSTPVFVLLAIIGYAWVSLEHPITVRPDGGGAGTSLADAGGQPAFVGATPAAAAARTAPLGASDLRRRISAINCLSEGRSLTPAAQNDLTDVKLRLMAAHWEAEWGDFDTLRRWALGLPGDSPPVAVQALFMQALAQCES